MIISSIYGFLAVKDNHIINTGRGKLKYRVSEFYCESGAFEVSTGCLDIYSRPL